jgi:hypothetical protein
MTLLPQLLIAILIWAVMLGTFISPELKMYSAQLVALLLLFYIIIHHIQGKVKKKEVVKAQEDEETLLFLSTYLKPKLRDLCELSPLEENRTLLEKQLQIVSREVERYLELKEKEVERS